MARRLFPDEGSRFVVKVTALDAAVLSQQTVVVKVYTDSAATIPANIADESGAGIPTSLLTVDATTSKLPIFQGPADGTDTLYIKRNDGTGPINRVNARVDDRIDNIAIQRVYMKDFGPCGNGSAAEDTAALLAVIARADAVGGVAELIPGTLHINAHVDFPTGVHVEGAGLGRTTISKEFNGDLITMNDSSQLRGVTVEGNGSTYTGKGVVIPAANGGQRIADSAILRTDGECIWFSKTGGSLFVGTNLSMYRYNSDTGSGRYAVTFEDGAVGSGSGNYKKFIACNFNGKCSFSFGCADGVFIVGCDFGDLEWTGNSSNIQILGGRWYNQAEAHIKGTLNIIMGPDINPQLFLDAGCNSSIIDGEYNHIPTVDNSGSNTNRVNIHQSTYVPVFGADGGGADIGNGTITGSYSRQGNTITFEINFTVGSTTNFGSGALTFTIPQARASGNNISPGTAICLKGGTSYVAAIRVPGNVNFLTLFRDNAGQITGTSPVAWGAGDSFVISGSYQL
jgi:hypothetical protein